MKRGVECNLMLNNKRSCFIFLPTNPLHCSKNSPYNIIGINLPEDKMIDSNKYHSHFDHLATAIDKRRPELVKRKNYCSARITRWLICWAHQIVTWLRLFQSYCRFSFSFILLSIDFFLLKTISIRIEDRKMNHFSLR